MTDYYDHQYSTYDHVPYDQQQLGQEYSGHTLSYVGDPHDENIARRSGALGSHHSHSHSHGSVSASTRSWVQSNMMNPPLPPTESGSLAGQTPFHTSRPLPDPQTYQPHHIVRRPLQYDDVVEEEDEDEEPYSSQVHGPLSNIPEMDPYAGYQPQPAPTPMRYIIAGPSSATSPPSTPGLVHQIPRRNRSFVGGFFHGLKRLPKMFRGGEKRQIQRRPTFGTEGSVSATGFTPSNTLPRYLSNPSIGPSNPQFAHRLSQAVANGTVPPDVTPSAFQLRPPMVSPQQPMLMVTAPSDGEIGEEQQAEYFEGPPMEEQPFYPPPDQMAIPPPHLQPERATYMAYNRESEAPTITPAHPTTSIVAPPANVFPVPIIAPPPPAPPIPVEASPPPPQTTGPRVSYPAELPTRATMKAQSESYPLPSQAEPSNVTSVTSPRRRFTNSLFPSRRTTVTKNVLSQTATTATSDYTGTTRTSYYDPSFSSDLGPVEKFFKHFYHLPWISQGRVTVDYRPGESPRAKTKLKSVKKPMASWYHAVMSRSRRNSLDLISSPPSTQVSNTLSSLGSPYSPRSGRSSSSNNHHRHKTSKSKHHRSKRRRTATSSSTDLNGSTSPMIPNGYPYPVPPYLPYAYPYGMYPPMAMPPSPPSEGTPTSRMPRGSRPSRSHRRRTGESTGSGGSPKYGQGGYAPFQPLAMPTPGQVPGMYFMPPPPQNQSGAAPGQAGAQQQFQYAAGPNPTRFSPGLIHYAPPYTTQTTQTTSRSDPTSGMVSPPTTPHRNTAASVKRS